MASLPPSQTRGSTGSERAPTKPAAVREESGTTPPPEEILYLDLTSSAPLPDLDTLATSTLAAPPPPKLAGMFWLDGDALMCACPDCQAPMSVRLWLMLADCWRCGTSIELTQEQEREALRLMQQREQAMRQAQQEASPKTRPAEPRPATRPVAPSAPAATPAHMPPALPVHDKASPRPQTPTAPVPRERAAPVAPPARRRRTLTAPPISSTPHIQTTVVGTAGVWLQKAFRDMPAWLLSLIFHLVALTILGFFTFGDEEDRTIILSLIASNNVRREGGDVSIKPIDEAVFDLPVPDKIDPKDAKQRETLRRADQDAKELRLDPNTFEPQLADVRVVKEAISQGGTAFSPLVGRDPRVRVEMVKQQGGTTLTEAAVARGLRWLAKNQHRDGSWQLHSLPHADGGQGAMISDPAATSLALLPFLGAGQTHLVGNYKDNVAKGLRWLVAQQKPDGDLRGNSQHNCGMYAHGQCAIVLCEAYALSHDEALKEPAQKAIDFIVNAQHSGGGWRYEPGQAGDTSVMGWQLMALQSARYAKLKVPPQALENADHYLDTVASNGKSRYAYQRGGGPTPTMTAEALLCRIYLGWQKDEPGLNEGVSWLGDMLPNAREPNIYYWYYATQTMKQYGGPEWERWNLRMRDVLVSTQHAAGRNAGSWSPDGPHAAAGGRIYMTSLAVLTLEIYYRHLPVFDRIKIE